MRIDIPARIAFLKKIHIFHGLEDDALAVVAEELEEVNVAKDEVIFKQDAAAEAFYMIHGGSVRIARKQDGREYQLALLVRDDYFGEMALVSNRRRSATVTAVQDTSLLLLSRADFKKLFKEHPEIEANLPEIRRLRNGETTSFRIENRYIRKNGQPVWVEKLVSMLGDKSDGSRHYIALVTDTTARRRAEEDLGESRVSS